MIQGEIFQFPFGISRLYYSPAPNSSPLGCPEKESHLQTAIFFKSFCRHVVNLIISVGFFLGTGSKRVPLKGGMSLFSQYKEWHYILGAGTSNSVLCSPLLSGEDSKPVLTVRIFFKGG